MYDDGKKRVLTVMSKADNRNLFLSSLLYILSLTLDDNLTEKFKYFFWCLWIYLFLYAKASDQSGIEFKLFSLEKINRICFCGCYN